MPDTKPLPPVHTAVVLFTIRRTLELLLLPGDPWQLPVADLGAGEDLDTCAQRALTEATGVSDVFLEQLYTFRASNGAPGVVVSYYALIPYERMHIRPGSSEWVDPARLPPITPGSRQIVACANERLAAKLEYAPIAYQFLADRFTLSELQSVYEIISRQTLDKRNFRRRMRASPHLLETRDTRRGGRHRPARLYRLSDIEPSVRG